MKVKRGDVVLAVFPHAIGTGAKKRPVVVAQSDVYNQSMHNTLVAEITSNLTRATDPAHLLIDLSTSEGRATGLLRSSIVSCINLATLHERRIDRIIGSLSPALLQRIERCLKVAMSLR
jgi:mRNA-degrading endonuclease toxin of MazEF toxin-antitoxin module